MIDSPIAAACFLSFMAGLIGRELLVLGWRRYHQWRLDRSYQQSVARMEGCKHERTVMTDTGMGLTTPKCLDCWALHFGVIYNQDGSPLAGGWTANGATPKQALKLTRKLQEGRQA